jgi:hypothetical protein
MQHNFSTEYSGRSDDELLRLASDRASLTTEAATALEAELVRRDLTESDQIRYQQSVTRHEHHDAKRRRLKIFRTLRVRDWGYVFRLLVVIALISFAYSALPSRYQMKPDWQAAAENVMFASVAIAVSGGFRLRKIAFWISLVISSAIHLLVVHAWIQRVGNLGRGMNSGDVHRISVE